MKLRKVKIEKRFVPEFCDNKKLPQNEQVVVIFSKIPGRVELENYMRIKMDATKAYEMVYNDQMLLTTFIERIDNLYIEDEETGLTVAIRNGKELCELSNPELADLHTEIRNYVFPEKEDLSTGELKA